MALTVINYSFDIDYISRLTLINSGI